MAGRSGQPAPRARAGDRYPSDLLGGLTTRVPRPPRHRLVDARARSDPPATPTTSRSSSAGHRDRAPVRPPPCSRPQTIPEAHVT